MPLSVIDRREDGVARSWSRPRRRWSSNLATTRTRTASTGTMTDHLLAHRQRAENHARRRLRVGARFNPSAGLLAPRVLRSDAYDLQIDCVLHEVRHRGAVDDDAKVGSSLTRPTNPRRARKCGPRWPRIFGGASMQRERGIIPSRDLVQRPRQGRDGRTHDRGRHRVPRCFCAPPPPSAP